MVSSIAFTEAQRLLKCAARACVPYGDQVVIGGRMALVLYRHHDSFSKLTRPPLGTREVDAVVPRSLPVQGKPLVQALDDEGLVPFEAPGLHHIARGKQTFQDKSRGKQHRANEYVEFVAPRRRDEESMVHPQESLLASPLRFIDLLLVEPIIVDLDGLKIHVAGPAMFVAQKVLMRTSATGRREDKDLVSIFDAAQLSAARWPLEREVVQRVLVSNEERKAWFKRLPRLMCELFGTATSNGSVAVATALASQPDAPSAHAVSRIVMDMCSAVFEEDQTDAPRSG